MSAPVIITAVVITVFQFLLTESPQALIVTIDRLRSTAGQVVVSVFDTEEAFPTQRNRAFRSKKVPVSGPSMTIRFDDVPAGTYGVTVYHDENSNNKIDRAWYGMPVEGYGASNNATGTFGPPEFKDAKFAFDNSEDTVKIILQY